MDEDIFLTDQQYLTTLKLGRNLLNTIKKADGFDCNIIGCKNTETNIGLCNPELVTKETSLWPERKVMKYRKNHHKCPLDWRTLDKLGTNGCFYTCRFFKKKEFNIENIKRLYDERILEVKT